MPWPIAMDYQDALQSPHLSLSDPTLQTGQPKSDQFGMPTLTSGNFASVCQLRCNGKKYAVRCFVRYHPDQERRYEKISSFLQGVHLPCMAGFEFLKQGIRIRGQWYPILKMEWIDGQPLDRYVKENFANPLLIRGLAKQFLDLVTTLRQHSIAHGDLQHGNIIVTNNGLRLIDYDGMYVPALAGMQNRERGHPNYQHPRRHEQHFGPYLDNFSAWTIYASLIAISVDSTLWYECGSAEDQLLFRKIDFDDPTTSDAFRALRGSHEAAVQALASSLHSFVSTIDLSRIPPLEERRLPLLPPVQQPIPDGAAPEAAGGWIEDWTADSKPTLITRSYIQERLSLGVATLTALLVGYYIPAPEGEALAFLIIVGLFGMLRLQYGTFPEVCRRKQLLPDLARLELETREAERQLHDMEDTKKKHFVEQARKTDGLTRARHELAQKERTEIDACEHGMQTELRKCDSRRQSLNGNRAGEIRRALETIQRQYLSSQLQRFALWNSNIKGIGPQLKQRLQQAGFKTAADIVNIDIQQVYSGGYSVSRAYLIPAWGTKVGVEGIGPEKASNLLDWKRGLESKFISAMPKTLPSTEEMRIESVYKQALLALEAEEVVIKRRTQERKAQIRQTLQQEQDRLARALRDLQHSFARDNGDYERKLLKQKKETSRIRAMLKHTLGEYRKLGFFTFGAYIRGILNCKKAA